MPGRIERRTRSARNMQSCVLPSGSMGTLIVTKTGKSATYESSKLFSANSPSSFTSVSKACTGMKLNKKLVAEKPSTLTGAGTVGAKAFETRVLGR
ncbi:hypothetical protein KC364_g74 [Hortaea werneckii]|nr:hypothetical protein KC364_g74 [Hortaea werneckii]